MEKYTKTTKPCCNFLFSIIKMIKLHSASINPVINQGFNFKWPNVHLHYFGVLNKSGGRQFEPIPQKIVLYVLPWCGIKNIRSH